MPFRLALAKAKFADFRDPLKIIALVALSALVCIVIVNQLGVPPRKLAPYLERRTSGHNALIEQSGQFLGSLLTALDRGRIDTTNIKLLRTEGFAKSAILDESRTEVLIGSASDALKAIQDAKPGDTLTFLPGIYRFGGKNLAANRAGSAERPITVRAAQLGKVILEFDMLEGFLVSAPYWSFENLTIRGVCKLHSNCEHAFHVVGNATHFIARNNTLLDFNAHFKINGHQGFFPDHGIIENNALSNESARQTDNPVTPIDLVAASNWQIRGNRIADFIKLQGDKISYGAFAKGAGDNNRIERNIVICEDKLRLYSGQRVGLSLGGGGSSPQVCRDKRCIVEQKDSRLEANLIISCSDDGIYLNRAAASQVRHNTLIDTGPIAVRFGESSAEVEGNLVDSAIVARDQAIVRGTDNMQTSFAELFLGRHPIRALFADAAQTDLRWKLGAPTRLTPGNPIDLCAARRKSLPAIGASDDYSRCPAGQ